MLVTQNMSLMVSLAQTMPFLQRVIIKRFKKGGLDLFKPHVWLLAVKETNNTTMETRGDVLVPGKL